MTDKTLTCKDCGAEFVFTVGEQEFYKEKGFDNEPKRCLACRRAKKALKTGITIYQYEQWQNTGSVNLMQKESHMQFF